jgi:hypothetical protein
MTSFTLRPLCLSFKISQVLFEYESVWAPEKVDALEEGRISYFVNTVLGVQYIGKYRNVKLTFLKLNGEVMIVYRVSDGVNRKS